MVSASTNPRLFGDARLSTAATTVFHGQWLIAWAVNPSPCTSQGLCAVSDRRLSADFRRRQHCLLAPRSQQERRAALADHQHGRLSAGVTGGAHRHRESRWGGSSAHRLRPQGCAQGRQTLSARSPSTRSTLAEPAAAGGWPSRPSGRRWRPSLTARSTAATSRRYLAIDRRVLEDRNQNAFSKPFKLATTAHAESDVLLWFKGQSKGGQTRMNAIPRDAMLRAVYQKS